MSAATPLLEVAIEERQIGSVARVFLNRPDVRNALNPELIGRLAELFGNLGARSDIRVVVLSGSGRCFCAGADLQWMRDAARQEFSANEADAAALAAMLHAIHACPKPVIARVHGAAFGGGAGLAAACDLVAAAEGSQFCFSETKLGLIPAVISPFVLQKLSRSAATRYFLTAERFDTQEGQRLGLVTATAPDEAALDLLIDRWIGHLLENGPHALASCKALLDEVADLPLSEALRRMPSRIAACRASAEAQEGMSAFLEKRPPAWIVQ
jgi:methylglutaconyl-CoA hydratase